MKTETFFKLAAVCFVLFTITLAVSPSALADIPVCGDHFFTKVSYEEEETSPEEAERATIFTTDDEFAIYRIYEPHPYHEHEELVLSWYDSDGNQVMFANVINNTLSEHFNYGSNGLVYCLDVYFYISGHDREPGQYRVDVSGRQFLGTTMEYLFTDYFQICVNPCFKANLGGDSLDVPVLSNSSVTGFGFDEAEKKVTFQVDGTDGTRGFCNATIPNALFGGSPEEWKVLVDNTEVEVQITPLNATYTSLYFAYTHSAHTVTIIPEFPSWLIVPLFMIATLLAVTIYKRKRCIYAKNK
jgi:hypothetical protein